MTTENAYYGSNSASLQSVLREDRAGWHFSTETEFSAVERFRGFILAHILLQPSEVYIRDHLSQSSF